MLLKFGGKTINTDAVAYTDDSDNSVHFIGGGSTTLPEEDYQFFKGAPTVAQLQAKSRSNIVGV